MVMIGTEAHKRTHTVVALDDIGRRLDELTVVVLMNRVRKGPAAAVGGHRLPRPGVGSAPGGAPPPPPGRPEPRRALPARSEV
jgi:hypothetical protein